MCLGNQSNPMSVIWGTKAFNLILHKSRVVFRDFTWHRWAAWTNIILFVTRLSLWYIFYPCRYIKTFPRNIRFPTKHLDGKLVKWPLDINFFFFLTFYSSSSFCFMKLKGASFSFPACSLCWLLKYSRADIENLKQVQATLSQNPNAIKNIYQNATTFPSHPGWTQTYWVTQNMIFLKLHLNIWLTRDTHPFSSC